MALLSQKLCYVMALLCDRLLYINILFGTKVQVENISKDLHLQLHPDDNKYVSEDNISCISTCPGQYQKYSPQLSPLMNSHCYQMTSFLLTIYFVICNSGEKPPRSKTDLSRNLFSKNIIIL